MLIKSVSKSVKDVFLGNGWDTWVRVDLDQKKVIGGSFKPSESLVKTIFQKVHK